ncbi:MAG: GNAT family N-acetyltransferase [Caulobacteraceae bacterium]|nr:GNAT family N-acetyltransferase [Caulobacteraceae bacterium]
MASARWRAMTEADLPQVTAIARQAFPDHYEADERFAERLRAEPDLCWALEGAAGDLGGYIIAGACRPGTIPPLDAPLEDAADSHETIYLYDLALRDDHRGGGHAGSGAALLFDRAASLGVREITLVSVNASADFWRRRGFADAEPPPGKLASYGADARYMTRSVKP